MDVYIEFVIIDNIVINSVLLIGCFLTLKLRINFFRVLLSAIIGTAAAIAMTLVAMPPIFVYTAKTVTAVLMVVVARKTLKFKEFAVTLLLFLLYTFVLGGACIGILGFLGADMTNAATLTYYAKVPVGLIVAAAFTLWLCTVLSRYLHAQKTAYSFITKAEISIFDRTISVKAFVDTGNSLTDRVTGFPVVVIGKQAMMKIFGNNLYGFLSGQSQHNSLSARYISYTTASGKSKMMVFKPQKIVIYNNNKPNTISDIMLGYSATLSDSRFDALLPSAIINQECT